MIKKIDTNNITEYGIKIVIDEEKIIREGKYTLEEIYKNIDDLAEFSRIAVVILVSKAVTSFKGLYAIFTTFPYKSWNRKNEIKNIFFIVHLLVLEFLQFLFEKFLN